MNTPQLFQTILMITLHGGEGDTSEYTIPADKIGVIETRKNGNKNVTVLTISPTGEEIIVKETRDDIIDLLRCGTRVGHVRN